jgi:hypothetical protein
MKKFFLFCFLFTLLHANPPVYIAFHWHMHQPIYWPYESVIETDQYNRYDYSVADIHNQRTGPYTSWPMDAIQKAIDAGLEHAGAQISFSGSLIENLNALEIAGNVNYAGWKNRWKLYATKKTSLDNPRLDFTAFGYHHPLMGLIPKNDMVRQITSHRDFLENELGYSPSKGIFPPENAFRKEMIPALKACGIEWVLVDNIHFERACLNYPFNTGGNLYEPNPSYILNPDPGDWVSLNNVWAPTQVSALWSRQPHYVGYIDPESGETSYIIAVPADRYLGNEDGRGGFGALDYNSVLSQLESYNTDPDHPMLIVLAHDGDNYGGGSESYYNSNFQNFIDWLIVNKDRFIFTTVQDYLDMFPPDPNDVIEVESGSWSGADNGDPEFKKWLGDSYNGYSPDKNSWAVVTAGQNAVYTAESSNSSSPNVQTAWKYLMNSQTSCYWYWDGSQEGRWDSHPTRAINQAYDAVNLMIPNSETVPPTIFHPQREPFNPGGTEWLIPQTNRDTVWTFVYDVSGLKQRSGKDHVLLFYRFDNDGINSLESNHNELYSGGTDVSDWVSVLMEKKDFPSHTNPLPSIKAPLYTAVLPDTLNVLIDYYVEAEDIHGNIGKSIIQHVWIGNNQGSSNDNRNSLTWLPSEPTADDTITIIHLSPKPDPVLHWGVNEWQTPPLSVRPSGTVTTSGSAVETPFMQTAVSDSFVINIGPLSQAAGTYNSLDFVIGYSDNTWNNNNGSDFHITFTDIGSDNNPVIIDGMIESSLTPVFQNEGVFFYCSIIDGQLYVATNPAPETGKDVFIFVSNPSKTMTNMPWAKSGLVMEWKAFLAQESTNGWNGWTSEGFASQSASAHILEGIINLDELLTDENDTVLVALIHVETQDNGQMTFQYPDGNEDINLDPDEWMNIFDVVSIDQSPGHPRSFEISHIFPNPFNPITTIHLSSPGIEQSELVIYNLKGQLLDVIFSNKELQSGTHSVKWDASSYSSGLYILVFRNTKTNEVSIKKITLLK